MSFFNSTAEKTGGAIQTERYKVPLSSCRSSGFVMLLLLAGVRTGQLLFKARLVRSQGWTSLTLYRIEVFNGDRHARPAAWAVLSTFVPKRLQTRTAARRVFGSVWNRK